MEGKLLVEQERNTLVKALAEVDNFKYSCEYEIKEEKLRRVNCNVTKENNYIGTMRFEGNSSFNFQEEADAIKHIMVFKDILDEIKGDLKELEELK